MTYPARLFGSIFVWGMLVTVAPTWANSPAVVNVLVARDRTEPVVAVDPRHSSTIVVQTNTDYNQPIGGAYPTGYFVSHDAGRSFSAGSVPIVPPYTTAADPSVAIAGSGTQFFAYLGEAPAYCSNGGSAVLVGSSLDGGRSISVPVVVNSNPVDDKPYMAVQTIAGQQAHVFVSWNQDYTHATAIWFARSSDGGRHFGSPVELFHTPENNFGSVPVVGPGGQVYVFWSVFPDGDTGRALPTRILMRASTDNGRHFGPARNVSGTFTGLPHVLQPGALRVYPSPAPVVDRQGRLYLAWATVRHDYGGGVVDADILISRSRNGGKTWSTPRRVNDTTRADRFFPAMTVLGDGSLGLAFHDRRASRGQLDTYAARVSFAGGFRLAANVRVNQHAAPISDIFNYKPGSNCFASGRFFGDYLGVAPLPNTTLAVVWADPGLQIQNETDIWFARVSVNRP